MPSVESRQYLSGNIEPFINQIDDLIKVSVAHFHGRFIFHMPGYNNDPSNQKTEFDPNLKSEEVFKLCGCDPSRDFEFMFRNVRVNQVTYNDGTSTTDINNDSI